MPPTLSRTHLPQPPAARPPIPAGGAASPASILPARPGVCILRARRLGAGRYRAPGMPGAVVRAPGRGGRGGGGGVSGARSCLRSPTHWALRERPADPASRRSSLAKSWCLGKVRFEVTRTIESAPPNRHSSLLCALHRTVSSLSGLGHQTADNGKKLLLPGFCSIYLYLLSKTLSYCSLCDVWVGAGWVLCQGKFFKDNIAGVKVDPPPPIFQMLCMSVLVTEALSSSVRSVSLYPYRSEEDTDVK